MDGDENFNSHKTMLNLFVFFAESLFLYAESLGRQGSRILMEIMGKFQFFEADDTFGGLPLKFIAFTTVFLSCAIPLVMFIVFGVTSIIITFAGFLFIEGTLLAFGGFCTCACIVTLMLVLSALALTLGVFYMLALKLVYVLKSFEPTSNIIHAITPPTSNGHITELAHAHRN